MGYTITVRVTDATNSGFTIAEKNVWHYANGGSWSDNDSVHTLVMGGSGTSGMLCFKNGAGEKFLVVLGIHNYVRWCDIVTDLGNGDTGTKIQSEYYSDTPRGGMLWEQLDQIQKKSAKGTTVDVKYIKESGNSFVVKLLISA
jgi:hypothetical protein